MTGRIRFRYRSIAASYQSSDIIRSADIPRSVRGENLAVFVTNQPPNHSRSPYIDPGMGLLDRPVIVPCQCAGRGAARDGTALHP
ncbi:hypothetical protein D3C74_254410 [compost metagenome]